MFKCALAITGILLQLLPQIAHGAAFRDTAGTRYSEAAEYLAGKGAVQGYSDGKLKPYAAINRVEAIKALIALQQPLQQRVNFHATRMKPLPLFLDLDAHAWYMPYVETAFEARLITGYPDRTFKPRRSLTVEEAIALILRAYHEDGFTDSVRISPAIDNRQGEWFTRYINGAIDRNLLSNAEQFTLGRAITRGQFFDIAYRMDYIRLQNMARYDRPETWNQPPERVNLPRAPLVPPNNAYQNRPTTTASNPVFRPAVTSPSNQIFISIPALGIQNLRVSHATDMTHNGLLAPLKYGVGHLFGYPGGNGKILIYGHSSSYGWDVSPYTKIFRKINLLKPGDRVTVTYGGQIHQYEMTHSQSVPAGDMTPYRGSGEELLLYTCWPPDSIKLRWVAHLRPVR